MVAAKTMKWWRLMSLAFLASLGWTKEEKNGWDVNNPSKETYNITLHTREGTWMSVDVSPDGKSVVFDMLGDLFLVPIKGGEAQVISQGLAWDMQPRFSPDGTRIVFTSDRGGGDNLWTVNRDGSDFQEVTKETFRLLNSPTWSPDGEYIAARKHFTASRSLGAGEIWLYHRAGGSGLQLSQKTDDEKDVGEPAFSPDGRFVYFSQDTTPGPIFEYNKNPHPGIYSIKRIDLEKGEVETILDGPGGAIRPTPSPDGRFLAFVGRRNGKTALFAYDLKNGERRLLYDGLDRDMQETWAIHGVYPGIAWTPDAKALVFWAQGKINRINVDSLKVTEIPFSVKTQHKMVKVLRNPIEVAPDRFDLKMLRWAQVSPNEDRVVYQALGYIYIKALPDGRPQRLTKQNDAFEFYPRFSRDGKELVYTTWSDKAFGTVSVYSFINQESRVITQDPGHYIEPVFSPDGDKVAYVKAQGGYLRSPLWSIDPGIYVVPATGGASERLNKEGRQPHFGKDSERLFFVTLGEQGAHQLKSVNLEGRDERHYATSEMGGELLVSPDGSWLAFSEGYNAYITPFVETGKERLIGPKDQTLPVARVSQDAGTYLSWNANSDKLFWSLADELYHRDLREAFRFIEGAPDTLPEPKAEGLKIGFTAESSVPQEPIAYMGARIITMEGDQVIERGTLVVKGNRIVAVGASDKVKIPKKAKVLDVTGSTIIPGLIDVHCHLLQATEGIIPQQNWLNFADLAFGVTTIHDPSNETSSIFAASEMARTGAIVAPRLFSTGTILYGAKMPLYTAEINNLDNAKSHLRRMKAVGAFSVKSYNQPRRNQRQQVIVGARELDMMVVAEGGSLFQHNMTMIADGHTGIEHNLPVAAIYDDVVQFWSQSETFYTPTLVVSYGGINGEYYWYKKNDVWEHPLLSRYVPGFILEPRAKRREIAPEEEYNHIKAAQVCKKLLDAGVSVQLGAHGQREGLGAHWELWMFVQGGMTPLEALRCGTLNGARYLGLDGDIGSLKKGKLADFVILNKNPLESIYNTDSVDRVSLNGRLYDVETMNEVEGGNAERAPFFWEQSGSSHGVGLSHSKAVHRCSGHCGE